MALTQAELGLVINFGGARLQVERLPNFLTQRNQIRRLIAAPSGILYPELTNQLIDALSEVYYTLGSGFLPQVYRRAVRREFMLRTLNCRYIKELPLRFAGQEIRPRPVRLFAVDQRVLLATVAVKAITPVHIHALRCALQATGCRLGMIANFYPTELELHFERTVR